MPYMKISSLQQAKEGARVKVAWPNDEWKDGTVESTAKGIVVVKLDSGGRVDVENKAALLVLFHPEEDQKQRTLGQLYGL